MTSSTTSFGTGDEVAALIAGYTAKVSENLDQRMQRAAKAALVALKVQNYSPAECPLCKAGIPAVKPGSRVAQP